MHPERPPAGLPLNLGLNQSILEFPFDTTRMIINMITSGATLRFPNVKMIASHGGGTSRTCSLGSRPSFRSPGRGPGGRRSVPLKFWQVRNFSTMT